MLRKIKESADLINNHFEFSSEIAIILGSGLSDFIREIECLKEISYKDIPHFPVSHVEGHHGSLVLARYNNTPLIIMNGRVHFYEGYTMEQITYPVRVLKYLGVNTLLISNAAGGMNPDFIVGDLMLITDHIHLMPNPLIGHHIREFGERFPDMSQTYDFRLNKLVKETAMEQNLLLKEGIYIGVTGPTYETPAEYRYFRIIGGDAIGMSTTPEVIVAHQMGIKCMAISVITDLGIPGKIEKLTHKQVQKEANHAEPKLAKLIKGLIDKMEL